MEATKSPESAQSSAPPLGRVSNAAG